MVVVEDDAGIAATISAIAQLANWEVVIAGDGQEALRHWGERRPDLLLLDLMLPGALDGLDVYHDIRGRVREARALLSARVALAARGPETEHAVGTDPREPRASRRKWPSRSH